MVKRDDAQQTSLGSARDTDQPPASRGDSEELPDVHEACYRPEMGTIIVHDYTVLDDSV